MVSKSLFCSRLLKVLGKTLERLKTVAKWQNAYYSELIIIDIPTKG